MILAFACFALAAVLLAQSARSCLPGLHARDAARISPSYVEEQVKALQARNFTVPPRTKTALINVRVFDGYHIHQPSTVVIDGSIISFDTCGVSSVIDGCGGILLPGLIDSHCHVSSLSDLEALSSYGVTTAMNMNCQNYTLCHYLRNQTGLTTMFTAGVAAVAPNSTHAILFHAPGNALVSSPAQAPQFVADVFNNGSDYLKIVSEPNGVNQASQDALVHITHALGKQSMTHAADLASYQMAILSKTNGLQHIPFDSPLTEKMAEQIAAQHQYVTPTLNIGKIVASDAGLATILSTGLNLTYAAGVEGVKRCARAGIPILAGTDAISSLPFANVSDPMGLTLHWELENLVGAGLSNAEVLRAATMIPARWHNLTGRGIIKEGMRADLLLLKPGSNPLVNISQTREIARVWNGGIEYTGVTETS